jgi:hypothetical protein
MTMVTPERFAKGMTFEEYVRFTGSPENLAREGLDVRRGGRGVLERRLDWSEYLRERYAKARLGEAEVAAIKWLAAQPGGPASVLVISEDWSSDCRRDVPYLARLAEAGGLDLRIFTRDGEKVLMAGLPGAADGPNADLVQAFANEKNGEKFATIPVAAFYAQDFTALYRYVEYPVIYHKERLFRHFRSPRAGETPDEGRARGGRELGVLFDSPFFDVWAHAAIVEILSALHERLVIGGERG